MPHHDALSTRRGGAILVLAPDVARAERPATPPLTTEEWERSRIDPLTLFLLLAAPAVGSFIGLTVDRFETGRGIVRPGSRCDHCGAPLCPLDLVPILSWLWRRGRSRCCDRPLRVAHPLREAAAMGIAVWAAFETDGIRLVATTLLGWTLFGLAAIDLKSRRLPDLGTLPLILAGLALSLGGIGGPPAAHALGAVAGYASLAGVAWAYRRLRGVDGLGLGDAKLFAAAGAWVGVEGLSSTLLIGALTGLATALALSRRGALGWRSEIPFGPGLAIGFWLVWLYGPWTLV